MAQDPNFKKSYTSRPVLKIKNTKTQRTSVHTFTDAILRFGKKMDLNNIEDAYRRAGSAFKGTMEQNFVVLSDNKRFPAPAPQRGLNTASKKRPLDDQQTAYNQRKDARGERGGRGGGGARGGGGFGGSRGRNMAGGSNSTPKN